MRQVFNTILLQKQMAILNQNKEGFNLPKFISEDGRFIIVKETKWYLYDEKAPDVRWCRFAEDTLEGVQNEAERILEEENEGRDAYLQI